MVGVERKHGDADRCTQEYLLAAQQQRALDLLDHRFGQARRRRADILGHVQHDEFVTAKSCDIRRLRANAFQGKAEARRQLAEHFIASFMAQGVVDPFEIIQVHKQQRQFATARMQRQQAIVQQLTERKPVGQAGQRVGIGHAPDVAVMFGDALAHAHEGTHQVANFVVAIDVQQGNRVLARLVLAHHPAQAAHGFQHAPIKQVDDDATQHGQHRQHRQRPAMVPRAG